MDHTALARKTLEGLEERLQRLRSVIYGDTDHGPPVGETPSQSIGTRLKSLEKTLGSFEQQSRAVQELLRLNKQDIARSHGDDFHDTRDTRSDQLAAAVVLSHATQYNSMASSLRAIESTPMPDASACVHAISQGPRLQMAARRAEEQQRELAELRAQSVRAVERWHSVGVLSLQDALGEWEDRLMTAEKRARQDEARRKRDEGAV